MSFQRIVIPVLAAALIASPAYALDQEQIGRQPTTNEVLADTLIARPLGVVATLVGYVGFLVSLPFSLPSGSVDTAGKALIEDPARYTFLRPIGQLDGCQSLPESCKGRSAADTTEGARTPVITTAGSTVSKPGRR
jgi:hypothetical protein